MKNYYQPIIVVFSTLFMTGCFSTIPAQVRNGEVLPTTLEMCHSMFIDSNDRNYNSELEIKHLREEIEQLKKAKK